MKGQGCRWQSPAGCPVQRQGYRQNRTVCLPLGVSGSQGADAYRSDARQASTGCDPGMGTRRTSCEHTIRRISPATSEHDRYRGDNEMGKTVDSDADSVGQIPGKAPWGRWHGILGESEGRAFSTSKGPGAGKGPACWGRPGPGGFSCSLAGHTAPWPPGGTCHSPTLAPRSMNTANSLLPPSPETQLSLPLR